MRTATMECQYCGKGVHFAYGKDMRGNTITTAPCTKDYDLLCKTCYEFIKQVEYTEKRPIYRILSQETK